MDDDNGKGYAMSQISDRYVDAGGIRTHYIEQGTGDPVILIHGGGAGADGFSNFAHCLPVFARHMRAIAVDMVGFGDTDQPDPAGFEYTQEARTKHMIDFIDALGLKSVALVGNSMGGTTAAGVAIKRPDLVTKLVLMGAAVNATPDVLKANAQAMAPVVAYDGTIEGMKRILGVLTHSFEATPEQLAYRHERSIRPSALAANKATMGWVRENGLWYSDEALASLQCPVFVIAGKNDVMVTLDQTYKMISQIPQSIGHILPNCGHWIMIEYPEEFNFQTLRFLGYDA